MSAYGGPGRGEKEAKVTHQYAATATSYNRAVTREEKTANCKCPGKGKEKAGEMPAAQTMQTHGWYCGWFGGIVRHGDDVGAKGRAAGK